MSEDPFAKYMWMVQENLNDDPRRDLSYARRSMEFSIELTIRAELKKAVGDEGLTPKSLEDKAPVTLDVLGISDGQAACEIIRGALDIMAAQKNAKYVAELRNAFGGEGYPKTLKERRQAMMPISGVTTIHGVRWREYVGLEYLVREIMKLIRARSERAVGQSIADAIDDFRRAVEEQTALLRQIHGL